MKRIQLIIILLIIIPLSGFSQNYLTLSGIITDAQNGKSLDGIDVVVKDKSTGTITDTKGAYILYLNPGQYQITYLANGYKKAEVNVDLNDDFVQMVELTPKKKENRLKKIMKRQLLKSIKNQVALSDNLNSEGKK